MSISHRFHYTKRYVELAASAFIVGESDDGVPALVEESGFRRPEWESGGGVYTTTLH